MNEKHEHRVKKMTVPFCKNDAALTRSMLYYIQSNKRGKEKWKKEY